MRYEILKGKIVMYLDNPDRARPHVCDLSWYQNLPVPQVRWLLEVTVARIAGKRYKTQLSYLRSSVAPFGKFVAARGMSTLPVYFGEWQHLVLDLYTWFLSNGRSKASLVTRTRSWDQTMSCWLCMLGEEGILPKGLMIPKTTLPRMLVEHGSARWPRSIGDGPAISTEGEPIGRTLYGPIFWTDDVTAIEQIQEIMASRLDQLDTVLNHYAGCWLKDRRTGMNLIRARANWVAERAQTGCWKPVQRETDILFGYRPNLATHPKLPGCEATTLAVLAHILNESTDVHCLSAKTLQKHPAFHARFPNKRTSSPQDMLLWLSALTDQQLALQTIMSLYMRFLGILSPLDIAVACAILVREHPNLNPESLISARLLNARGRSYLIAQDRAGSHIFSVDKPRAGCRKYASLSRRAMRVLRHILRATEPVRLILKRSKSKFWRHLFLGSAGAELGHPAVTARQLTGLTKYSLLRYYPQLKEAGLVQGTLDFAKIRATVAMLVWFKTGSVVLASRKLGNTYRVALENYIPKEVRRLWNERVIRRFQNILILLANSKEESNLRVSDIETLEDLNSFLAQITHDFAPGTSVIADRIGQKFARRFSFSAAEDEMPIRPCKEILSIVVSAEALTALYKRRKAAEVHGIREVDGSDALCYLAELLFNIADRPNLAERSMGLSCAAQLRIAHKEAMAEIEMSKPRHGSLAGGWKV